MDLGSSPYDLDQVPEERLAFAGEDRGGLGKEAGPGKKIKGRGQAGSLVLRKAAPLFPAKIVTQ
jgi:hypothetical protein